MSFVAHESYNRRPVPNEYDRGWIAQELSSIQRAISGDSLLQSTRDITTASTPSLSDVLLRVDATSGAVVVTLPVASAQVGRVLVVKKVDASANAVTVTAVAPDTIDGAATSALTTQYASVTLHSHDTGWDVLARV